MDQPVITNSVTVEFDGQLWWVKIVEDDEETTRSFENQEFADNFASGQRVRLGLS